MDGHTTKGAGALRAGVARSDITADAKDVAIHDPLYAKALVLDDGVTRVAIIAMDALAIGGIGDIGDDFLPKLRQRLQAELGIPGNHVLVNASHTHPPGRLLCDDAAQVERTFDAVRRAVQGLTGVTAGWGCGHEDRLTMNRTLRLKNGKHWSIRYANPCPPDEEVAGVGPIDPEIGILRIDRLDGRPLAVVYNFACHLLLGDLKGAITANFPGVASGVIEETLGHGAMALFLQGAAGDVVDVNFKDFGRPRDIQPLGLRLGLSTLKAYRAIQTGTVTLRALSEPVTLPRRTDIPQRIAELESEQAGLLESLRTTSLNFKAFLPLYLRYGLNPDTPADYSFRYLQAESVGAPEVAAMDAHNRRAIGKYLANIHAMERLARIRDRIATYQFHQALNERAGVPTVSTEVQGIRIGDGVLITSAAEVLTEVGLNIKSASPYEHTFLAAYTNGYLQYGPPATAYDKGGYEVTECFLASEWQAIYEAKAADIIRRL